jgi:hypothetical protein
VCFIWCLYFVLEVGPAHIAARWRPSAGRSAIVYQHPDQSHRHGSRRLDLALVGVHQLAHNSEKTVEPNALQQTVGRAAAPYKDYIESFLRKINGYQRSLRDGGSGSRVSDAAGKIKWSVMQKDELAKFSVETMGMLLRLIGCWSQQARMYHGQRCRL